MNYVLAFAQKEEKKMEVYDARKKERNTYKWEDIKLASGISSHKKIEKINKWLNTEKGELFLAEAKKEESLL